MTITYRSDVGMTSSGSATYTPASLPPGWQPGDLLLTFSASSSSSGTTTAPGGWTLLSPNSQTTFAALFGRIAQLGDTVPSVIWSAGTAIGDCAAFAAASKTVNGSADRFSSSTNLVSFSVVTRTPSLSGCVVICAGRKIKSTTSNGATFGAVNPAGFTKIGQVVPAGAVQAGVWYYSIQTSPTSVTSASCSLSIADGFAEPEGGFLVILQPATQTLYPPPREIRNITHDFILD